MCLLYYTIGSVAFQFVCSFYLVLCYVLVLLRFYTCCGCLCFEGLVDARAIIHYNLLYYTILYYTIQYYTMIYFTIIIIVVC